MPLRIPDNLPASQVLELEKHILYFRRPSPTSGHPAAENTVVESDAEENRH